MVQSAYVDVRNGGDIVEITVRVIDPDTRSQSELMRGRTANADVVTDKENPDLPDRGLLIVNDTH